MLFLLFQLGNDRYAIEASRVVEVVPLLTLKKWPQAPPGLAGIFNYRGRPVPAIDLCQLTLGHPANQCFSTRIILVTNTDGRGANQLLGLVAEHATEVFRKNPKEFVDPGLGTAGPAYLGPVLMDLKGPIQWIHEQSFLSEPVRSRLAGLAEPAQLTSALGEGALPL